MRGLKIYTSNYEYSLESFLCRQLVGELLAILSLLLFYKYIKSLSNFSLKPIGDKPLMFSYFLNFFKKLKGNLGESQADQFLTLEIIRGEL